MNTFHHMEDVPERSTEVLHPTLNKVVNVSVSFFFSTVNLCLIFLYFWMPTGKERKSDWIRACQKNPKQNKISPKDKETNQLRMFTSGFKNVFHGVRCQPKESISKKAKVWNHKRYTPFYEYSKRQTLPPMNTLCHNWLTAEAAVRFMVQ